jgi:hypothetical protein
VRGKADLSNEKVTDLAGASKKTNFFAKIRSNMSTSVALPAVIFYHICDFLTAFFREEAFNARFFAQT